jgi:hypothetical protein
MLLGSRRAGPSRLYSWSVKGDHPESKWDAHPSDVWKVRRIVLNPKAQVDTVKRVFF